MDKSTLKLYTILNESLFCGKQEKGFYPYKIYSNRGIKNTKPNNGYNSLLGLVKVRQTFCIFNLISYPKILADLSQRNHNPKPLPNMAKFRFLGEKFFKIIIKTIRKISD
ncbi:hypothetical protein MNBD_BACTEROID04-766 [hydrothermal vent metagenome]|uniref:Uncharacterized protein n=1 Tax=hydrothermal vent metagenome TaxID=652676 RepID=A0A3B0U3F6_9ZZZZ